MGIFDIFKKKKSPPQRSDEHKEIKVKIISEPKRPPVPTRTKPIPSGAYDFDTLEGIQHIKMPKQSVDMHHSPEYMLQLAATRHFDEGNDELAFACLRKSNELMPLSQICIYPAKTYCRLVKQLKLHDRFDEAAKEEEKLRREHPEFFDGGKISALKNFHETLEQAKELGTDLVEMSAHENTCGECAKYQGRVFSISGTDKEFPPLPKVVFEYGGIHLGCRHIFYPFIKGSPTISGAADIVSFSNRPFIDDRSPEAIRAHEEYMERFSHYMIDLLGNDEKIQARNAKKKEYSLICENLPNLAPKSYSGYSRMKKNNTKNYQKIKQEMKNLGFDI